MIRAANLVWASGFALAVLAASPSFATATRDCSARGETNRTMCRANSAKAGSLDPGWLGRAIAAMPGLDASALLAGPDANARLAADTRLTRDSAGQGKAVNVDAAFMRALESKPVSIGSRIKRLRAGAATAAASATSGYAFRSDAAFNLTGNFGSYGGTRAGGIQMGTSVSERVALNAGVTKGFNKASETVGRVGITLGW